jgi:hypothetical protein
MQVTPGQKGGTFSSPSVGFAACTIVATAITAATPAIIFRTLFILPPSRALKAAMLAARRQGGVDGCAKFV